MDYLPIFAHLKNRPVLVIGGGEIAYRKIQLLLEAGACVQVIARCLGAEVQALVNSDALTWLKSEFVEEDVNRGVLTIAATNDTELNQRVYRAGEAHHRLVNVVDNKVFCSFIVPAIVDRSPVQIAISTGGASPVLARQLREKLEQELPPQLGTMARLAQQYRPLVKSTLSHSNARRIFWEQLFANPLFEQYVAQQQLFKAQEVLKACLSKCSLEQVAGHVTLVGAGPGDAGLLTIKGFQALQAADVVLYDALVSEGILNFIRRDAKRISVGKRVQDHSVSQSEINQLLLNYANQGLRVVRLKGGDPFVFGRGAEEIEVLQQAHVPYSIVPGITAALGATAYAGIPLTHRDYAQSALLITGHCRADGDEIDWPTLARARQTLVVYMGTIKAVEISTRLIAEGKSAKTPVAIISQGTLINQKTQVGVLSELGAMAEHAVRPALIVIGEVVTLHKKLDWFKSNPEQKIDIPYAVEHQCVPV